MENVAEFERWLEKMLCDAKKQLAMSDEMITYILLREGANYYLKTLAKREQNIS